MRPVRTTLVALALAGLLAPVSEAQSREGGGRDKPESAPQQERAAQPSREQQQRGGQDAGAARERAAQQDKAAQDAAAARQRAAQQDKAAQDSAAARQRAAQQDKAAQDAAAARQRGAQRGDAEQDASAARQRGAARDEAQDGAQDGAQNARRRAANAEDGAEAAGRRGAAAGGREPSSAEAARRRQAAAEAADNARKRASLADMTPMERRRFADQTRRNANDTRERARSAAAANGGRYEEGDLMRRLMAEEAIHRTRTANLARLRQLAQQSGDADRVAAVRELEATERSRFERLQQSGRQRSGATFDRVRTTMQTGLQARTRAASRR